MTIRKPFALGAVMLCFVAGPVMVSRGQEAERKPSVTVSLTAAVVNTVTCMLKATGASKQRVVSATYTARFVEDEIAAGGVERRYSHGSFSSEGESIDLAGLELSLGRDRRLKVTRPETPPDFPEDLVEMLSNLGSAGSYLTAADEILARPSLRLDHSAPVDAPQPYQVAGAIRP